MSLAPTTPLTGRVVAAVVAMTLAVAVSGTAAGAAPTTYYVDCNAGNDSASGRTPSAAWLTLTRANSASLVAGDSMLLKRGCTWTGPLNVRWSGTTVAPIRIGAYSAGERPTIQNGHENVMVTGSHLLIENITTRSDAPGRDTSCENQPLGWRVGFRFMSGASYDTVRYSRADDQYIGILVEATADHIKILNNTLRNNDMRDPKLSVGAGAVGVALMGDDNEVGYNYISGSDACSPLYGRDGAAVEVYGGSRNLIHHNKAADNHNFTELGKAPSADNTYAYNLVTSSLKQANFLVTRGPSDEYGPVFRTRLYNNTVYLSGSASYALQCYGGCAADILTFKNNIVWAQDRIGFADNAFDESNNIYWRADGVPQVYFPIASSSKKTDPEFIDIAGMDFHLRGASPAVDVGSADALAIGLSRDLDGVALPQAGAPDIGAYERTGGGETTPPTTTAPILSIQSNTAFAADSVQLRMSWVGVDMGSGVSRYWLQERLDAGAWRSAALSSPTATQRVLTLPLGTTLGAHVRAFDRLGNVGPWAEMPSVKASAYGETTSLATYEGTWRTAVSASAWRGRTLYATAAGAIVKLAFSGQAVGLVSTTGPGRGRANVFLDGQYVRTLDLGSATTRYRQVVFTGRFAAGHHTLQVVLLGTTGRTRMDVDGFVVLR